MSLFLIYILLWLWDNRSFDAINDANAAREQAQVSYFQGNFDNAAELYSKIVSNFIFIDPLTRVNLAHATFQKGEYDEAKKQYELLVKSNSKKIATVAQIQLGMIALQKKDTSSALIHLKDALKTTPNNDIARYNYEVLRRQFSGQLPTTNTVAQKSEIQKMEQQTNPVAKFAEIQEPSLPKKDLLNKLERLNLSEEETQAILDAMKTNELQYIYQLRRNQYHSSSPSKKNKVEW